MRGWIAAATTLVALIGPVGLGAQNGVSVEVAPRVGALTPADWFYAQYPHLGTDPLEWTEGAILRTAVAGLAAQAEVGESGLWIRGEVLRTFGGDTYLAHAVALEASEVQPPGIRRTRYWVPSAITFGSLDLGFPTRFTLPFGIQPYVSLGVGGKRYSFDVDDIEPVRNMILPEDGVVWMANVGGGATVDVLGVELDFLARDAVSEYWGRTQHDVTWIVATSWRIF